MNIEEVFDNDYENDLKIRKETKQTGSYSVSNWFSEISSISECKENKPKFFGFITTALNSKIGYAAFFGRKYTSFSTSHESEILNKDTKEAILKYLKDEGFKVVLRERSNPHSKHLMATILVSWN